VSAKRAGGDGLSLGIRRARTLADEQRVLRRLSLQNFKRRAESLSKRVHVASCGARRNLAIALVVVLAKAPLAQRHIVSRLRDRKPRRRRLCGQPHIIGKVPAAIDLISVDNYELTNISVNPAWGRCHGRGGFKNQSRPSSSSSTGYTH
jgi:hypothetical protein